MIIRSLSRKSASFRQLFFYINREKDIPYFVSWNLNMVDHLDHQRVLNQFYENASLLKSRKNGNYLYHEILSIKLRSEVSLDRQMKALHDLSRKYIQARGPNLLSYGRMHIDDKSLHMHVMFSANELNQENRFRLSQAEFAKIQRQCEQYLQQTYPELKQPVLYDVERSQRPNKSRQREYEFTKRTGKKTKKQQVKEELETLFQQERSGTIKQLLREHGFELYQRGKHYGVIHAGMKYRLGTLGLADEFLASKKRGFTPRSVAPEQGQIAFEREENQSTKRTNMEKIYEQLKILKELRELELRRRAALTEKCLRKELESYFPGRDFTVSREGKTVHVEMFAEHRSVSFSTNDLGDFPLGEDEEYVQNRREREVMELWVYPLIKELDSICSEQEYGRSKHEEGVQSERSLKKASELESYFKELEDEYAKEDDIGAEVENDEMELDK